jgi:hypothetical protein
LSKMITTLCFISLRSPTKHENAELRHSGMDGRHPGSQDASGDIHAGLDSSTPHAGMTESRSRTKTDQVLTPRISKERYEGQKKKRCVKIRCPLC